MCQWIRQGKKFTWCSQFIVNVQLFFSLIIIIESMIDNNFQYQIACTQYNSNCLHCIDDQWINFWIIIIIYWYQDLICEHQFKSYAFIIIWVRNDHTEIVWRSAYGVRCSMFNVQCINFDDEVNLYPIWQSHLNFMAEASMHIVQCWTKVMDAYLFLLLDMIILLILCIHWTLNDTRVACPTY